jgi:hypothetical protein
MKTVLAFLLIAASSYALSFALDLLVGGLLGVYPAWRYLPLPVVTWSILAAACGVVAVRLAPTGRFLIIPALVIAAIALFGGVIGHRHNFIVGAGVLAQAAVVWLTTGERKRELEARTAPGGE